MDTRNAKKSLTISSMPIDLPVTSEKKDYVRKMFSRIAPYYDRMNRIITFGQDSRWRRRVIDLLQPVNGRLYLDVGAGTGDLSKLLHETCPDSRIIAADLTWEMVKLGKDTKNDANILWILADAQDLPFANGTFDGTVSGFLFRNVPDMDRALVEQIRILTDRSRLVSLDTTPPSRNILYPFILLYFRLIIPAIGKLLTGDLLAYSYLPESTQKHVTSDELFSKMTRAGFRSVGYEKWMAGTMAIHYGVKS
jgi:demethylmenaquinone methyltransferase / 2-methoxy-6-polyprenyl-1,4-benzoquinol methylase